MLRIQMFGNQPQPAWASDTPAMRAWVNTSQGHVEGGVWTEARPVPKDQEMNILQGMKTAWDQQGDTQQAGVVAWSLDQENETSFGWAGSRVRVFRTPNEPLSVEISQWTSDGWQLMEPKDYRDQLATLAGMATGKANDLVIRFRSHFDLGDISKIPLTIAPWEHGHMLIAGGIPFYPDETGALHTLSHLQHWGKTVDEKSFIRWVGQRLRHIGKRFPEMRYIWAGLLIKHEKTSVGPWMTWALACLHKDARWQQEPWRWLCAIANEEDGIPARRVEKIAERENVNEDSDYLPFLFHRDTAFSSYLGVDIIGGAVRRWALNLTLSQARRYIGVVKNTNWEKQASPGAVVAFVLAKHGLGVPAAQRLRVLLETPHMLMGFLRDCPAWMQGEGEWHVPNYYLLSTPKKYKIWTDWLSQARHTATHHPHAFRGRVDTAVAFAQDTAGNHLNISHTEDSFRVLNQINNPALINFVAWDTLGKTTPWAQCVEEVKRSERKALIHALEQEHISEQQISDICSLSIKEACTWLRDEPQWQTWRDAKGNSVLDWALIANPYSTPSDEDLYWLRDECSDLLVNVGQFECATLERLEIEEEKLLELKRMLIKRYGTKNIDLESREVESVPRM